MIKDNKKMIILFLAAAIVIVGLTVYIKINESKFKPDIDNSQDAIQENNTENNIENSIKNNKNEVNNSNQSQTIEDASETEVDITPELTPTSTPEPEKKDPVVIFNGEKETEVYIDIDNLDAYVGKEITSADLTYILLNMKEDYTYMLSTYYMCVGERIRPSDVTTYISEKIYPFEQNRMIDNGINTTKCYQVYLEYGRRIMSYHSPMFIPEDNALYFEDVDAAFLKSDIYEIVKDENGDKHKNVIERSFEKWDVNFKQFDNEDTFKVYKVYGPNMETFGYAFEEADLKISNEITAIRYY